MRRALPGLTATLSGFHHENETNFLAFPQVQDSWVIFGAG